MNQDKMSRLEIEEKMIQKKHRQEQGHTGYVLNKKIKSGELN
jgi:hypothetical protein